MNETEKIYNIFRKHPVVSIDSRNVPSGSVFFGIKGPRFNGNDFAAEAINKGAVCAVVDETAGVKNDKFFRVDNTLETLQSLARIHRQKRGYRSPTVPCCEARGKGI